MNNRLNLNSIYERPLHQGDYVESRATGPAIAWGTQKWLDRTLVLYVSPTDGRDDSNGTRAWLLPVREVTNYDRRDER